MKKIIATVAAGVASFLLLAGNTGCSPQPRNDGTFPSVQVSGPNNCPVPTSPVDQHPNNAPPAAHPDLGKTDVGPDGNLYYLVTMSVHVYDTGSCSHNLAGEIVGDVPLTITLTAHTYSKDSAGNHNHATLFNKALQTKGVTPFTFSAIAPFHDDQHFEQLNAAGQGILDANWDIQATLLPGWWMTCDVKSATNEQISEDTAYNEGASSLSALYTVGCQWPLDLKPHMFVPWETK